MTAQTLPDDPNYCFVPAYDIEDEVQQIRIVGAHRGHVRLCPHRARSLDDKMLRATFDRLCCGCRYVAVT